MKKLSDTRVLLVDDEELIRIVLKRALERFSGKVDLAKDGQEAMTLFQASEYDIILTDVRMPGMSGDKFIKKIRQTNPDLPIIVISAFDVDELPELDRSLIQGIQKKPIAPSEIKELFLRFFAE